ncbi:MAG TPA: hypothetical protein VFP72_08865 [Kineosporiaceae bacterium]|nr:hypothetical protein [Kineosporiaceae bacterium]
MTNRERFVFAVTAAVACVLLALMEWLDLGWGPLNPWWLAGGTACTALALAVMPRVAGFAGKVVLAVVTVFLAVAGDRDQRDSWSVGVFTVLAVAAWWVALVTSGRPRRKRSRRARSDTGTPH